MNRATIDKFIDSTSTYYDISSMTNILIALIFGTIAIAMCSYAKKKQSIVLFVSGAALMLIQYFVEQTMWLVLFSIICCAVPYFVCD